MGSRYMDKKVMVDVVINVCGKPYQTALTLLSLMRYSGSRHTIDRSRNVPVKRPLE